MSKDVIRRYFLNHDGYVNVTDVLQRIKELIGDSLTTPKPINYDPNGYDINSHKPDCLQWTNSIWISQSLVLNFRADEAAKECNIITTVIVPLAEVDKVPTEINGETHNVYYYALKDTIKVSIKAGSKSCFDNSDKLQAFGNFTIFNSNQINPVNEFIKTENERIAANVDRGADHTLSHKQTLEALNNAALSNN